MGDPLTPAQAQEMATYMRLEWLDEEGQEKAADLLDTLAADLSAALAREAQLREALRVARDAVLTSCCDTDICSNPRDGCAHGGSCIRLQALAAALASSGVPAEETP